MTPVADDLVGIAMLTERRCRSTSCSPSIPCSRSGWSAAVLAGARRRTAAPALDGTHAGRVLLVGDAAGYVDALTGEGIALGLAQARAAVEAVVLGRPALRAAWKRLGCATSCSRTHCSRAPGPAVRRQLVPLAARLPPGLRGHRQPAGEARMTRLAEVVLLDDEGRAIGTAPKAGVHGTDTPLHLAFSCYVFDEAGPAARHPAGAGQADLGGVWTNSCCGHPAPGEPIAEAVAAARARSSARADRVTPGAARFRYRAVMDNGTVENELCPVFIATAPRRPPRPAGGRGRDVGAVAGVPRPSCWTTRGQPLVPRAGRGAPGGRVGSSGGRPCRGHPGCQDRHLTPTG